MPLNSLGLGFLFTAKDLASGVMGDVKKHLLEVEGTSTEAAKSIGESFKSFGVGLAVMGAGLAGLEVLDSSVEAAHAFGKAIDLVTTRVSEAEFPMEAMKDITNELSAKFGVMPVDEAKALGEAVAAGARDAATAASLLTAANQLATGTQTDLGASMAMVSQVAKTFKVDLKDSATVADALFVASTHVEGGVNEMGHMLEMLGPTAASTGMKMEELLATFAQLDVAGIRGRPAISGMKSILDTLLKPTEAAKEEAARLGIAFDTTTIKTKGLPAILAEVSATGRMTSTTLEKLFGSTEAGTVALGLMRNGGQDLAKMMNEVAGATGAAGAAAAKMVDPAKQFEALKDQVLTLIGEALLPLRKRFYEALSTIADAFTKLDPQVIDFFTYLFFGASILAVIVGGSMALSAAFTLLAAGAEAAGISVSELWVAAWSGLWPVLVAVALAALAFEGLKIAFDNNFGGIADIAREVWDDLKLTFTAMYELFSGGGFTEDTWQKLEKHSGIRDFAIGVYGWVERIVNFFKGIGTGFEKSIGDLKPMFNALGVAIQSLVDTFGLLAGPSDGAADSFDSLGVAGEGTGKVLVGVFGAIVATVQLVIAAVQIAVAVVVGVFDTLKSAFSGVIDIFYGVAELVDGIITLNWTKIWHGFKMIAFGAIDGIIGILLSLIGIIGGAVDAIAGLFGKKTSLQKDTGHFRDYLHNEMAKDFGVADASGLRTIHDQTAVEGLPKPTKAAPGAASAEGLPEAAAAAPGGGPLGSLASLGALGAGGSPGLAAAGLGVPGAAGADFATMTSHLEQISKNTGGGGPPVNVTVMMDGEAIGRAVSKAKQSSDTRSFLPSPIPE